MAVKDPKNIARELEHIRVNLGKIYTIQEARSWVLRNPGRWSPVLIHRSLALLEKLIADREKSPEYYDQFKEQFERLERFAKSAERRLYNRTNGKP